MSKQSSEKETATGASQRYESLASIPFAEGYPTQEAITTLKDELVFQRAVQTYLWALPALNIFAMKEGSEKVFGKGYNILPIKRYSLGTKNKDLKSNADGSLTIYVQADAPTDPVQRANWLPAPAGEEFSLYVRAYWPEAAVTEGKWTPPPVMHTH